MGSGRIALPSDVRRSKRVQVLIAESQWADLREISGQWGVSPSTVAYSLIAEALTRSRSMATSDPHSLGIGFAASLAVVQAAGFRLVPFERVLERNRTRRRAVNE